MLYCLIRRDNTVGVRLVFNILYYKAIGPGHTLLRLVKRHGIALLSRS